MGLRHAMLLWAGCTACTGVSVVDFPLPDAQTGGATYDVVIPDAGAPDTGATDAGTTNPSTPDAGAPDAGSADAGDGVYGNGLVFINQITRTSGAGFSTMYILNATFHRPPFPMLPAGCVKRTFDACVITECNTPVGPPPPPTNVADPGPPPPTAGTIGIVGALFPPAPGHVLTPGADLLYTILSAQQQLWNGGETLMVHAAGSATDVPAFDFAIVTPSLIRLTSPTLDASGGVTTFARANGMRFTWTGGDMVSNVIVTLNGNIPTGSLSAKCTYPASSGVAVVPQSIVDRLGAATLMIDNHIQQTRVVGDYRVNVVTAQPPLDSPNAVLYPIVIQ